MTTQPVPSQLSSLMLSESLPADRHPAAVYLGLALQREQAGSTFGAQQSRRSVRPGRGLAGLASTALSTSPGYPGEAGGDLRGPYCQPAPNGCSPGDARGVAPGVHSRGRVS